MQPYFHCNQTYLILFDRFDGGEVDVKLLDDTRVQRVEVHDEDELVPQATFGLKHKTTFVLVLLALGGFSASAFIIVIVLILDSGFGFLSPRLVRTDVL